MQIAKNKDTKTLDGEIVSKFELFEGDFAEDTIFTIPGFESIPLKEKKVLVAKTAGGDYVVIGVPLSTAIEAGERRITSTDANDVEKSQIKLDKYGNVTISNDAIELKLDKDGKITVTGGSNEMIAIIYEFMDEIKKQIAALSTATTPTALGPQLLSCAPQLVVSANVTLLDILTRYGLFKK